MKRLLIFCIVCIAVSHVQGQSCPEPDPIDMAKTLGKWKGAFSDQGKFVDFIVHLTGNRNDLKAEVTIPSVKQSSGAYAAKICDGEEIHLETSTINTSMELIGKPKDEVITGRLIYKERGEVVREEVFTLRKI